MLLHGWFVYFVYTDVMLFSGFFQNNSGLKEVFVCYFLLYVYNK
jgi:hypothetical protein